MEVTFSQEETDKVPPSLRGLMPKYPRTFDLLLEFFDRPKLSVPLKTIDVYFDEELFPALSFDQDGVVAHEATEQPITMTVLANDECAYVQIGDNILLNRLSEDFLNCFEVA